MPKIYKIMFVISMVLALAGLVLTITPGLNLGVDFKGGSVSEVVFEGTRPSITELNESLKNLPFEVSASPTGDNGMIFRSVALDEASHQALLKDIREDYQATVNEIRFDSVGPTVGQELRTKSIWAMLIVLAIISIYIAIVFRKMSATLSPWIMGLAAIGALAHDVLIPLGVFSYLGAYHGVEISAVFIAAILTILGYSVSDTVVIFDRVRENMIRGLKAESFGALVHVSVMQTLTRSINTGITTLLSLVAIYIFGGESIRYFALALIIGIFLGAYSSIFISAPILVYFSKRRSG